MAIDMQTLLLWAILIGGIVYETTMWIYRSINNGEKFSLEKYAMTYGYVGLIAVIAYFTTGTIPGIEEVMVNLTVVPNPETILPLVFALIMAIVQQGGKKIAANKATQTVVATTVIPFSMGYTVTPTYTHGKSPVTVTFLIEATQVTADHPGVVSTDIDWTDGSAQSVKMNGGKASVSHSFSFVADGSYTGHTFYPIFTFVGSDGSKTVFNVERKGVEIWVEA